MARFWVSLTFAHLPAKHPENFIWLANAAKVTLLGYWGGSSLPGSERL
jgi:hypothetical protein